MIHHLLCGVGSDTPHAAGHAGISELNKKVGSTEARPVGASKLPPFRASCEFSPRTTELYQQPARATKAPYVRATRRGWSGRLTWSSILVDRTRDKAAGQDEPGVGWPEQGAGSSGRSTFSSILVDRTSDKAAGRDEPGVGWPESGAGSSGWSTFSSILVDRTPDKAAGRDEPGAGRPERGAGSSGRSTFSSILVDRTPDKAAGRDEPGADWSQQGVSWGSRATLSYRTMALR